MISPGPCTPTRRAHARTRVLTHYHYHITHAHAHTYLVNTHTHTPDRARTHAHEDGNGPAHAPTHTHVRVRAVTQHANTTTATPGGMYNRHPTVATPLPGPPPSSHLPSRPAQELACTDHTQMCASRVHPPHRAHANDLLLAAWAEAEKFEGAPPPPPVIALNSDRLGGCSVGAASLSSSCARPRACLP